MVKVTGLIILTISLGLVGVKKSMGLNTRVKLLEDYLEMLLEIRGCINYFREPLTNIFSRATKKQNSTAFLVLNSALHNLENTNEPISKIWADSIEEIYKNTDVTDEDRDIFCYLGKFIGQTDYENQLAQFEYLTHRLEKQILLAKESRKLKSPLYQKIGFFMGGVIAIILM